MVATQDGNALRVTDLEGDEKSDSFNRIVAAIDIVSFEPIRSC
jgi:hypothetical protein